MDATSYFWQLAKNFISSSVSVSLFMSFCQPAKYVAVYASVKKNTLFGIFMA